MAYSTVKILRIVFFLVFISQGYSKCLLSDLSISQIRTGVIVQGKPEWSVTIINKCQCAQKNVILNCRGFQSIERIDPLLLTISLSTGFCLVKPGQLIYNDVEFKYAWDHQFPLNPISSMSFC
ncbi:hypothetical protein AAZX31_07G174800, partial [Glycine max]|nr:hypothetical protein JHK86_019193 [Glycine max]